MDLDFGDSFGRETLDFISLAVFEENVKVYCHSPVVVAVDRQKF